MSRASQEGRPFRLLLVADAASVHTQRWAHWSRSRGWSVTVASFRPASIEGVDVVPLGWRWSVPGRGTRMHRIANRLGEAAAPVRVRLLARRLSPDIVHAHYVTSYGFWAAVSGRHPLVVTAWGSDVLVSPRRSRLSRWLASFAVRRADMVTTVAPHMNDSVHHLGADADHVVAVPFGVDTDRFTFAPRTAPQGALTVISTRNLDVVYDIGTLIRAVGRLVGDGVTIRLRLIGDGPLRSTLARQVGDAGLDDVVEFVGRVAHEELVAHLRSADVFVSSAVSDGNNVSLNEAMACGAFPIATDIDANRQWITHGANGLLYSPGDDMDLARQLMTVVRSPRWVADAAQPNRSIVEREASWANATARMEQLYDALAGAETGWRR